jgi:ankyrin repeat protein
MTMIDENLQNLWNQILETNILGIHHGYQCDDNVKKNIITICSVHHDEELMEFDFDSITDKKNQMLCFFAVSMFNHSPNSPCIIRKIINAYQIDVNHTDDDGNNCLIMACSKNQNLEVIEYLINDLKMDINHVNYFGKSCLMSACHENTNLEIIKYLVNLDQRLPGRVNPKGLSSIDELKMNVNDTNYYRINCLGFACLKNTNLEIIKYLINDLKMDINYTDYDGDNCLTMACSNTNLEIIKYLINDLKMNININHTNSDGDNCLILACYENTNLEIIKYLINNLKMDINHTNNDGDNCLTLACRGNTNLEIIKYLINDLKMNINHTNSNGDNCLILACYKNTNLDVIKYLINNLKMDINYTNENADNCLTLACRGNTNLEIIKYLINDLKMDINHTNNDGDNCFTLAHKHNINLQIIQYLIESTNAKISFRNDSDQYNEWKTMIKSISKNFTRFRETLILGSIAFEPKRFDEIKNFLTTLNPLLLMDTCLISMFDLMDPMDQRFRFNDYMKHVNDLMSFTVPVPVLSQSDDNDKPKIHHVDFSVIPELLFSHNGSKYYGYRHIVYDSIHCLKEIKDMANFDQPIILNNCVPKYIMNLWISSMYNGRFDLMEIEPCDLISFLNHIDQYPTDFLTIGSVECDLIRYLDTNLVEDLIPCLKDMSLRCRLKRLYLWIHNKMIQNKMIYDKSHIY